MDTKYIKMYKMGIRYFCYKTVKRPNDLNNYGNVNRPLENINRITPNLKTYLRNKISATGPITVADYMRESLRNSLHGYYMHRDVFGKGGDFITSPEISQIFGELIGIWILLEWRKIGSPKPFQLIELGPGRGSLARDVLRVLTKFETRNEFSLHMLEISPYLSKMQAKMLCYACQDICDNSSPHYQVGDTTSGTTVYWYNYLENIPQGFSVIIANEFFDALPIHKLQLVDGVWKEILIDATNNEEFRYVISSSRTPISSIFKPIEGERRQCLEWSTESDGIIQLLVERLTRDGGFALIMDYGHFGEKTDTFRAFKEHGLHDPLVDPGTADLTADVDFRQLKRVAEMVPVACFGPVEQRTFLKRMQGDVRLKKLLLSANAYNQNAIRKGYEILTDKNQMGSRFKFLALFPAILQNHLSKFPVNGFY